MHPVAAAFDGVAARRLEGCAGGGEADVEGLDGVGFGLAIGAVVFVAGAVGFDNVFFGEACGGRGGLVEEGKGRMVVVRGSARGRGIGGHEL